MHSARQLDGDFSGEFQRSDKAHGKEQKRFQGEESPPERLLPQAHLDLVRFGAAQPLAAQRNAAQQSHGGEKDIEPRSAMRAGNQGFKLGPAIAALFGNMLKLLSGLS